MNLKKYIQSEIKSQLSESGTFDLTESLQGELDIMAQEAKDLKSFVKSVYKEFDNLPKNRDSLNWLTDIYKESTNESIVKEGAMSELDAMAQEAKDLKSFVKDAYKEFKTLDRNKSSLEWLTDIFNQATNESVVNEGASDDVLLKKYTNGKHKGNSVATFTSSKGAEFANRIYDVKVTDSKGNPMLAFKSTMGDKFLQAMKKAKLSVTSVTSESVNEANINPQVEKVAELTGVAIDKVEKYVSSRALNVTKLLKYIKDEKQVAIRDFHKAVKGDKKQDTYLIKMFKESVNERGTVNPEIWVPQGFNKEMSKYPNAKITRKLVLKVADKWDIPHDDALDYVAYNWVLDLKENTNQLTERQLKGLNGIDDKTSLTKISHQQKLKIVQGTGNIISFKVPKGLSRNFWQVIVKGKIKTEKDENGKKVYLLPGKVIDSPHYSSEKELVDNVLWDSMEKTRRFNESAVTEGSNKIVDYSKAKTKILVGRKTNLLTYMKGKYDYKQDGDTMYFFNKGNHFGTLFDLGTVYQELRHDGSIDDKGRMTESEVKEGLFKNITKGTKKSKGPWVIVVIQNGKVINQEYTNIPDVIPAIYRETVKKYPKAHVTIEASTGETVYSKGKNESTVNEEQLEEKLITFSNRANYGQIVFMAGGAGSGKGFAISNFIDSSSFKVRDVDEMKKAVGNLDKLGKLSIEQWYKKFSKNLKEDELAHVDKYVKDKKLTLKALSNNLRDPNNVSALHYIVDAMGLKDNWVTNMLMGKENKEVLPNLIFDITAKKVSSITDVLKPLIDAGYKPASIHLIWVLTNYHMAVDNNAGRSRVVPADTLLTTHEGASTTLWSMLTGILPNGINGRIDVILNNKQNTVFYNKMGKENTKATKSGGIDQRSNTSRTQTVVKQKRDDDGKLKTTRKLEKVKFVANFLSLPIKKQGGGVISEKIWKDILFKWIVDNAPASTELVQDAKS